MRGVDRKHYRLVFNLLFEQHNYGNPLIMRIVVQMTWRDPYNRIRSRFLTLSSYGHRILPALPVTCTWQAGVCDRRMVMGSQLSNNRLTIVENNY